MRVECVLTRTLQAHLRHWGRAEIFQGKLILLLSNPQDLVCCGNQQPGQTLHSLFIRKLDPNAPGQLPSKLFPGVGTVRRSSVITPTPPSSPIPTLTDGDASGLGEVERDPTEHHLLDLSQEEEVFFELEHNSGFLHHSSRSLDSTLPQQDQDRLAFEGRRDSPAQEDYIAGTRSRAYEVGSPRECPSRDRAW